jgi:hypothetical protein
MGSMTSLTGEIPQSGLLFIPCMATPSPLLRSLDACHHQPMSRGHTPSTAPDLFSTVSAREPSSASDSPKPSKPGTYATAAEATPTLPYVLPKDLTRALAQLQDQEFDRLVSAVLVEQKRRGGKLPEPDENSRKQRVELAAVTLPSGKLNAVRAAFKAGVKPSQIARQFGISQVDVRKALATGGSKA